MHEYSERMMRTLRNLAILRIIANSRIEGREYMETCIALDATVENSLHQQNRAIRHSASATFGSGALWMLRDWIFPSASRNHATFAPVGEAQIPALTLSLFACAALLPAAIGVYGVLAYTVAQSNTRFCAWRLVLNSVKS